VTAVAGESEHSSPVLAPSGLPVEERELLAQTLASNTVPWLTYAVHTRDEQTVRDLLLGLDYQELLALAVVLASRCSKPLQRPDDGVIDEIAVARACAGEATPLSPRERVVAAHKLADRGLGPSAIGKTLRVSDATAKRLLAKDAAEEGAV
jgi:hypothetical protein